MTDWSKLTTPDDFEKTLSLRKRDYEEERIYRSSLAEAEKSGWKLTREYKDPNKKIKVQRRLPDSVLFENRVWLLFARMGFSVLNKDATFEINYSQQGLPLTKQIDVFAADEETVLVVECKCLESSPNRNKTWKKELESINGYMNLVRSEIRKKFPDRNVRFIFATQDYIVGEADKQRMEEFNIVHFNETTIAYYEELIKHLGICARYQLLGALFAKNTIKNMDNRVPAIQGKMGGHTYYAFSIQPETLLKIGYVLHRNEANDGMLPTYQRIIKKERLKSVRNFVESGGYFPNSIVISVDTEGKQPKFELASKQGNDNVAKLGVLYLPNKYRSAYIIDGQHRLYGYSESKYSKSNSIPVVAFINMEKDEQVRLFMEINENQKAVSKNLRNTLNGDLLWESDDPSKVRAAMRTRLAQSLGDDKASPLYNRVIIGEDKPNDKRCITLETISKAIEGTKLLSKYSNGKTLVDQGIFDLEDKTATFKLVSKYLFGCFSYLQELFPDEWEAESPKSNGKILYNNGVAGFIRLLGDIAIELQKNKCDPKKSNEFIEEAKYYLEPLKEFLKNMTDEHSKELRSSYGGNGPRDYWRHLQRAVHDVRESFLPDGYEKYWEDNSKAFNDASHTIMVKAENSVREFVHASLTKNYPDKWILEIPGPIHQKAVIAVTQKEREGKQENLWDQFTMTDLREIVIWGAEKWPKFFESAFTLPSEIKKKGGKKAKTEWMLLIDDLQKKVGRAKFSVTKEQYTILQEVESILHKMAVVTD